MIWSKNFRSNRKTDRSCETELFEVDDDLAPTSGNPFINEAPVPHLQMSKQLLNDIDNYGPG